MKKSYEIFFVLKEVSRDVKIQHIPENQSSNKVPPIHPRDFDRIEPMLCSWRL